MKQAEWMVMLFGNLSIVLDCFVGMNNFWFPVEGEPEVRLAPDVYVAFGRPKGYRASYKQWEEANVPVTVVFEVLSPSNRGAEMEHKYNFYEEHGVEEYYIYDPDRNYLEAYVRKGTVFRRQWNVETFVSPRMGIRFDLSGDELVVYYPDGERFKTIEDLRAERAREAAERQQAEQRAEQAEAARQQAEAARQQAEAARQQAEAARQQAEAARQQAEQRAARMAALVQRVITGQATEEEVQELRQLGLAGGP
jgi:hypothetical protein